MRRAKRKCCTARISVGAIKAAWHPFSIPLTAAFRATMVFPLPTSPCSNRFIGEAFSRSAAISASTRFCAAVGLNGRIFLQGFAHAVFSDAEGDSVFLALGSAIECEAELVQEKLFK